MKPNFLLLFFLFTIATQAQIADLNKMSKGKLYSSSIIRNSNKNIKGYFLLFEIDKIAKETFELEYVVLDENLTRVTNGFLKEMKYSSLLLNADKINTDVTYFNNKLLIELSDHTSDGDLFRRYRTLDLKTNKLSDIIVYKKGNLEVNPLFDRKLKNFGANQTDKIIGLNSIGLIANDERKEKNLVCFDDNLVQKWKVIYETEKNEHGYKELSYINASNNHILFFNHYKKGGYYKPFVSLLGFDSKTGNLNFEFEFPNQNKQTYKIVDSYIENDELELFGNYSKKSDFGFIIDDENLGVFKFKIDLKTGKILDEKYLDWTELSSKIEINKNGKIKNEGNIFVHNLVKLENNKTIVVCEAYNNGPIATNNIYFIELSPSFTLNKIVTIDKFKNKYPGTFAFSEDIKKYGLFDFMDYQDMGDDEYLFYFNNNEKKSKNRNNNTIFGIVSYTNGEFKKQFLDLKTETSRVFAYPAKKGYIMLIEDFDDPKRSNEIRLEKINY